MLEMSRELNRLRSGHVSKFSGRTFSKVIRRLENLEKEPEHRDG